MVVKKLGILGFFGWLFQKFGRRLVNSENILVTERVIEIPNAYLFLGEFSKPGQSILEVGHVNSSFSLELATLGFQVTGIDLRKYPFAHDNLKSIVGNFLEYDFKQKFDWIISVSTIEHFGYNKRYGGQENQDRGLDKIAFKKISKLLNDNGKFVLTIPYAANFRDDTWFKTYTRGSIEELLAVNFNINQKSYFYRKSNEWLKAESTSDDPKFPYDGVGIFLLTKK